MLDDTKALQEPISVSMSVPLHTPWQTKDAEVAACGPLRSNQQIIIIIIKKNLEQHTALL